MQGASEWGRGKNTETRKNRKKKHAFFSHGLFQSMLNSWVNPHNKARVDANAHDTAHYFTWALRRYGQGANTGCMGWGRGWLPPQPIQKPQANAMAAAQRLLTSIAPTRTHRALAAQAANETRSNIAAHTRHAKQQGVQGTTSPAAPGQSSWNQQTKQTRLVERPNKKEGSHQPESGYLGTHRQGPRVGCGLVANNGQGCGHANVTQNVQGVRGPA
jgi:hypothetical protein